MEEGLCSSVCGCDVQSSLWTSTLLYIHDIALILSCTRAYYIKKVLYAHTTVDQEFLSLSLEIFLPPHCTEGDNKSVHIIRLVCIAMCSIELKWTN